MPNTFEILLSFPELSSGNSENNTEINNDSTTDLILQYNSILHNLSNQLTCPICQDIPTQPFLLPTCGHSFCYSCIKYWFQCNPSCPVCRSIIGENKPIVNHSLKNLIDSLLDGLRKTAKILKIDLKFNNILDKWYNEKNDEFSIDKKNDFPWLKKIQEKWGRAIVDNEDGVPRCSACHWELIDGQCENCGRQMVGWQDRTDGDELDDIDDDIDDDDNEDENLVDPYSSNRRNNIVSDIDNDDDWEDYDNGLNDMSNRIADTEAYESENQYDEDDDEDNYRHHRPDFYESDDGFVVSGDDEDGEEDEDEDEADDDDEDEKEQDNEYLNTSDVEIVDDGLASGDEDIIEQQVFNDSHDGIVGSRSKKITFSDDDDSDDDDMIKLNEDEDEDDKFIQTLRAGRKKKFINEEDEEDEEDEEREKNSSQEELIQTHPSKNKRHRKHKHRNKHKKGKS